MTESPGRAGGRWTLVVLVVLSLVTRLGLLLHVWLADPRIVLHPDSLAYQQLALGLVRFGQFSRSNSASFVPEMLRTPGYPAILALASLLTASPVFLVLLLQAIAATGTVVLTWLLGRRLAGPRVGSLAAFLVCFDLASIGAGLTLMTETFFALFLVASVWLFLNRGPARAGLVRLFLAGLALGVAVLIRPIGYYLPLLALAALFSRAGRGASGAEPRRRVFASVAVFLCGPLLCIGGWQMRNYVRTGSAAFSYQAAFNLLFYRAAGAQAMSQHRDLFEVEHDLGFDNATGDYSGYMARHPGLRRSELPGRWTAEAIDLIAQHQWSFLAVTGRGAFAFLLEPGSFDMASLLGLVTPADGAELLRLLQLAPLEVPGYLGRRTVLLLLTLYSFLGLLVLYAGFGLWLRRRTGDRAVAAIMLVVVGYFVLLSAGPEARARFRVPVMPLIAAVAAAGWVGLRSPATRIHGRQLPERPSRPDSR